MNPLRPVGPVVAPVDWKVNTMKPLRIRRRRAFLARMVAVSVLSAAAIGLGTGTVSARIMTTHPAKVTVPELKVSVSSLDVAADASY